MVGILVGGYISWYNMVLGIYGNVSYHDTVCDTIYDISTEHNILNLHQNSHWVSYLRNTVSVSVNANYVKSLAGKFGWLIC